MTVKDFSGQHVCSLDSKNRVNIPSGIRKVFVPEDENTLVFTRGYEMDNLHAYPLSEWQRLTNYLRTLDPLKKETRDFTRLLVGDSFLATMDGQGRVLIPERILKMGKIEKEILVVGALEKLEIWNPQVYADYLKRENLSLTALAEQVRKNKANSENEQ